MLLRVHTQSSLVLPTTLRTPEGFTASESRAQIELDIVIGLALCMLLYSLNDWLGLRDPLFLDYAGLLAANMLFVFAYFGLGAQYLWSDWPALSMQMAPMALMAAVAAGARFMSAAISLHEISRPIHLLQHLRLQTMLRLRARQWQSERRAHRLPPRLPRAGGREGEDAPEHAGLRPRPDDRGLAALARAAQIATLHACNEAQVPGRDPQRGGICHRFRSIAGSDGDTDRPLSPHPRRH